MTKAGRIGRGMTPARRGFSKVASALAIATAFLATSRAGEVRAQVSDAATPPSDTLSLSLEETIKRAEQRAPEVILAGRAVREVSAQRVGAGVLFPVNPRLNVDGRPVLATGGGATPGQIGYAASLEFLLDIGGAPRARVREAERATTVAVADLALERLRSRTAAWVAYIQIQIAETRIEETKALVGIAERIVRASKQRAAAGASGDIEESLATSDLGQLRASIESAGRQREEQLASLRDVLDLPLQPVTLTTPLEDPPPAPDKNVLSRRAITSRPELAVIRARLLYLDARYDRLNKENFPKVGAFVGVDASPQPILGIIGLSFELPVAQRNQGPRAVTEAARATETERQELQARRIVREVDMLHNAYESRRAELKLITGTAVPAAERTLELVEAGWLAGRFDVFRVASAAREVARVRAARLEALQGAWLARVALDRAAGGATP